MPRSTVTSQADKQGRRSVQVDTSAKQEQEVQYIIPGCLTEAQWMDMLIQEDADEAVAEIMEELLSKVMDGCYKVYFEKQLVQCSTFWAKNYLTQIVEQTIMCRDKGEEPEVASKTEDSEPEPTIADSWTGCVPTVNAVGRPSQQETDSGQIPVPTEPRVHQQTNVMTQTNKQPKEETSQRRPISYESKNSSKAPSLQRPQIDVKKKQVKSHHKVTTKLQVNSFPKVVPSKLQPPLSCSAEKKDVDIKGHLVHNHTTGSLLRHIIHQPIRKLDPSSLPCHFIFPQVEIVENSCVKPKLQQRHTKQPNERTRTSLKQLTSSNNQPTRFQRRTEADVCLQKSSPSTNTKEETVSVSCGLDTVGLAKGVSLMDPQAMNPPKLMPIRRHPAVSLISVDQCIAGPPRVTPLFHTGN